VRARAGDACRRRRCSPLACTLAGPLLDFSLFSSPFAFVFTHCASRHFSGSTSSRGLPALCFCFCRRLCTPCVFFRFCVSFLLFVHVSYFVFYLFRVCKRSLGCVVLSHLLLQHIFNDGPPCVCLDLCVCADLLS